MCYNKTIMYIRTGQTEILQLYISFPIKGDSQGVQKCQNHNTITTTSIHDCNVTLQSRKDYESYEQV